MTPLERWLDRLAYRDFPDQLLMAGSVAGTRPYAAEIEEMLTAGRGIEAGAVFCVGEVPTVCLIDGETLSGERHWRVEQIRQAIWNQNLATVVVVLESERLLAYSVNDRKAEPDSLAHDDVLPHGRWSAHEIQSGFIAERLSSWFAPEKRVDQRLLANLRELVRRLTRSGLTAAAAEALIAQVIFLCYLEQRGIVGGAYRSKHRLAVLQDYVAKGDGSGVDRLLAQLGRDFNGDFLSSSDGGAPSWSKLSPDAFRSIRDFLDAVDLETGQGSLWRYDFSRIPVELISGIYETLLKDRQSTLGAYYTPRHLANLVAEQAFEGFADPSGCSVYDGACGSGILLTTAFRKMLRHAEVREGRRLRLRERIALMQLRLFGNDLDETACWITAFSLYLSLLEGLEPADISLLQSGERLKLPPVVGPGRNIQKGPACGDFFSPHNPFAGAARFDIFLCNPPWRESHDDEQPTWEAWCRRQVPPYPIGRRQIAAGFAFQAIRSVRPGGVVVLIMPLNVVIGATRQSCAFRRRWLADARIERIINFGDIRRLLFPAAKHPCAVIRARPRPSGEGPISLVDENVEYWTPKTDISLALGRLALHAVDRKDLSAADLHDKPYALVSSYWGEPRDLDLLVRLRRLGSLRDVMASRRRPWTSGKGFHAANQSNPNRELGLLETLEFLPAERLPVTHPVVASDAPLEMLRDHFSIVASPGGAKGRLYRGPRVLFPDGLSDGQVIRAVFSDRQFAFTSSVAAIGGHQEDAELLKFLTIYLRSSLASYLLVMTGYSVIGERPRVALDDLELVPFCAPEDHPNPSRAKAIVHSVASTFDKVATEPEWSRGRAYSKVRSQLDSCVLDYFELSELDRVLVEDTVKYIATSIQPPDHQRISTPLLRRPSRLEIEGYVETLGKALRSWRDRRGGAGAVHVRVIVDKTVGFFGAVRVSTGRGQDSQKLEMSDYAFRALLGELQAGMDSHAARVGPDHVFKIPNIMVLASDAFYFVKPLRRRFWMSRTALADADRIVRTVHAAGWDKAH